MSGEERVMIASEELAASLLAQLGVQSDSVAAVRLTKLPSHPEDPVTVVMHHTLHGTPHILDVTGQLKEMGRLSEVLSQIEREDAT